MGNITPLALRNDFAYRLNDPDKTESFLKEIRETLSGGAHPGEYQGQFLIKGYTHHTSTPALYICAGNDFVCLNKDSIQSKYTLESLQQIIERLELKPEDLFPPDKTE